MSLFIRPQVSPTNTVSLTLSLLHPVSRVSLLNLGKVADSTWLAASRGCCKEAVCKGRWKYLVAEQYVTKSVR